jgi:hypothetical protein
MAEGWIFDSQQGYGVLFFIMLGPSLGPSQPPIQWTPGRLSPWLKRSGSEADHSPPHSAVVKNVELYLHSPLHLQGVVLNKIRDVGFEVLTAVATKTAIFRDKAPCSPYTNRRFGGTYHLHHQVRKLHIIVIPTDSWFCLATCSHARFFLDWFSTLKLEVILSSETSVHYKLHDSISQMMIIFKIRDLCIFPHKIRDF